MASPQLIQPSGADNMLYESASTTNYGTGDIVSIGPATGARARLACMWNFSAVVPAGATITLGRLSLLTYTTLASRTITAYRLLRADWVEAQATWTLYKTGSNWTTAGALSDGNDFTSTDVATAASVAAGQWLNETVTAQVQTALDSVGGVAHFLMVDEGASNASSNQYFSREWGTAISRPKLYIEYTVPVLTSINIGDSFKAIDWTGSKINIGDVWKAIVGVKINIGDVWKKVMWPAELGYYGAATALSAARYLHAAASVGGYVLFGGGLGASRFSSVDAYDASLTQSTPTALSVARLGLAGASNADYALFGGGNTPTVSSVVDAYDASLTRSTPTALSSARQQAVGGHVGVYALFAGGATTGIVDAYSATLVRSNPAGLTVARYTHASASVGNYALFGGGYNAGYKNTVDAYNTSLVRSTPTVLSVARGTLAGVSAGNYALFGGGQNGGSPLTVIDAYDTSLTRSTPITLSEGLYNLNGGFVSGYACFGGGGINLSDANATVNAFDSSLVRSIPSPLSVARGQLCTAVTGNYLLFGGGYTSSASNIVDVYYNAPAV